MANYQEFAGIKFREEWPGGYYIHNFKNYNMRMHRFVWEYYNGEIPEGYDVHHIDGNKGNNDISNLQLLPSTMHRKLHNDALTEEEREWRRQNLNNNARPKAIEWHKSDASTEWHSEHMKQQHKNGNFIKELTCSYCGKIYLGKEFKSGGNTFCSNNCKAKFLRRKRSQDQSDVRKCIICGETFNCSPWSKRTTCSKVCTNKLNWQNRKK